ncbi:hypothetical protein LCGC14_0026520 [marine sediment metagenome]|uniref:Uncharacterized protein n=1 Tax=marine sediment metagenome TaxID=412755 RepID=A0A0F9W1B3_9ZZZZ
MPTLQLELLADYFQFYLQDGAASDDLFQAWSAAAVARMLVMESAVQGKVVDASGVHSWLKSWALHISATSFLKMKT